jgi:hypothetical protein
MREIESARELLDDLLHDFQFASPADKANALAIPLERIVRELVDGPLPISAIEASTRGAGKGLLARVLLAITSTPTAIWSEVKDEAEIRKALTSFFAAGTEALLIDNLRHGLVSGVIAAAVTTDEWIDRLLGTNRLVRAKVRCSWIVTANNLSASSEILRRCSRIRLTPTVERPEERTDFRHPALMQWVVEYRSDLLRALIIFINHWIDYGRPAPTMAPLGSFESWTKTIGGILETNGITDFQANRREFADVADLETAPWRELIAKWWGEHTDKLVQSKDLFLLAEGIDGFPLRGKDERGLRTSFGTELRKFKDRVLAITANKTLIEVQVVMSPEKLQGAAQWRLVKDKANAA